ncbi:hypothetical protein QBC47DRAFT_366878 [Echria macrotheca]|uniref:Rhodopsin domain-containing protein n=1 Tax=Echria macrotheca TaxID=438768 RepID=A0AAJ0FGP1_9PEZI|nr:hypothetical protein QBC47DRAFT_366878 [Echria macrotheca]
MRACSTTSPDARPTTMLVAIARAAASDEPSDVSAPPPLPPGFDPNVYSDVPVFNRRTDLWAITIPFIVFSWICALFRLYVRVFVVRTPGLDDFFMGLALVASTICSVVLCIAPDFGFGRSIYTLTEPEIEQMIKLMYIGNFPYPMSVTFIKIALLFQYLRIFKPGSGYYVLCKYLIVAIALWGAAFAVIFWTPCIPLAAYWDFSITDARCWGYGSHDLDEFMRYFITQSVTTAVLDFVVFIVPARLYFQPKTERKTRIALLCLFALGLCVNALSLWRMGYVIHLAKGGGTSFDPTWYSPMAAGLSTIEAHLAVACAAMPVFWPTLEKTWNRIFVTTEVSVSTDYGEFPSKPKDVELQSVSSDKNLTLDPAQMSEGWDPFSAFEGDDTAGLGESETVIEALPRRKQRSLKLLFQKASKRPPDDEKEQ